MYYMDVPWDVFAKTTFCKDYTDKKKEYLASESRMVQILEKINMDSKTFEH